MATIYGSLHIQAGESTPDMLPGTIGDAQKLGVRFNPENSIGVMLFGTSQEIEAWLARIHALLADRLMEDMLSQYGEGIITAEEANAEILHTLVGSPPEQGQSGTGELIDIVAPDIYTGPSVWGNGPPHLVKELAEIRQARATADQIRPHLESWVPLMSDQDLAAKFENWTTDGDHGAFAAHLNVLYEHRETPADLVHAEQDEALGSVFGVDDAESPF